MCRAHQIVAIGQFFIHLLARAQAKDSDRNVSNIPHHLALQIGPQAGQLNHFEGQIPDFNRLAHIKDKNLSTLGKCACLNHQLHSLGNCHEIACHLRVGQGYRPAFRDLFFE